MAGDNKNENQDGIIWRFLTKQYKFPFFESKGIRIAGDILAWAGYIFIISFFTWFNSIFLTGAIFWKEMHSGYGDLNNYFHAVVISYVAAIVAGISICSYFFGFRNSMKVATITSFVLPSLFFLFFLVVAVLMPLFTPR